MVSTCLLSHQTTITPEEMKMNYRKEWNGNTMSGFRNESNKYLEKAM